MLLISVKNQLFHLFSQTEPITKADFKKIDCISDLGPEFKEALILKALEALEEDGVVTKIDYKKEAAWILVVPFNCYAQTLEIPGDIAAYMSSTLNEIKFLVDGSLPMIDSARLKLEDILFAFDTLKAVLEERKAVIDQQENM